MSDGDRWFLGLLAFCGVFVVVSVGVMALWVYFFGSSTKGPGPRHHDGAGGDFGRDDGGGFQGDD